MPPVEAPPREGMGVCVGIIVIVSDITLVLPHVRGVCSATHCTGTERENAFAGI